jgi:hypothetical protein
MKSAAALLCLAVLVLPALHSVAADPPPTCTPVGPCVPVQREVDDLTATLGLLPSASIGWVNLQPGNVRTQPLIDLPPQVLAEATGYAVDLGVLAQGFAGAAASDAGSNAATAQTWVLGTTAQIPGRAAGSAFAIANAGDAVVAVTVGEAGAWVSFLDASGVTLAGAALGVAYSTPAAAATAQRAANGGVPYLEEKQQKAAEDLVAWLAHPPAGAVQPDADENGLGDAWEDAVCRQRSGAPNLPPDACQAAGGAYHMARSYATLDFDQDGLGLLDEYRWNSDPVTPDTDRDGLPDGPESGVWRHSENDVVVTADLWTCPSDVNARSCAWRHPDSFRDDDGDGLYNMGQDPQGPLAALGAGDADSEGDALADGTEHYGCLADPAYGANEHADPQVPDFALCGGSGAIRGHSSDPAERDTDGDGLTDAQEVCSANGGACSRTASYDTDPQDLDTDGDGWVDGPEATFWAGHGGWFNDIDADRIANNLADPDSDRDGLQDGAESAAGLRADLWDSDQDGMPDAWETRQGFDPRTPDGGRMGQHACLDAAADADGDGLCNAFEYAFLRPTSWDEAHDGEWASILNAHQADMDGDQLPDGKEVFPGSTTDYFTRSAQQPPDTPDTWFGRHDYGRDASYPGYAGSTRVDLADTDGDGLTDATEHNTANTFGNYSNPNARDSDLDGIEDARETGTDWANWDTDHDGVADADEDPACSASRDCDADGLDDGQERALGCDPQQRDADGDGLWDGDEASAGSDCNEADSDGDGLNDFDEVRRHRTNPRDGDSDDDGLGDGDEVDGTPNRWHHARGAAEGDYTYATDHCASASAAACSTGGATDPLDDDTDGDGLKDGEEALTGRPSTLCSGGVCDVTYTNPNRADTDGDGADDKAEALYHCHGGVVAYDPTNFDMDGDYLADGREHDLQTDACNADTDHDLVPDGAEAADGGFGSDPWEWTSDVDMVSDFSDARPTVEDDPPLVLKLRPLNGDWRSGVCAALADAHPVRVSSLTLYVSEPPPTASTYYPRTVVGAYNPPTTWERDSDYRMLCVSFLQAAGASMVKGFDIYYEDNLGVDAAGAPVKGNPVRVSSKVVDSYTLDWLEFGAASVCWIPIVGPAADIVVAGIHHNVAGVISGGLIAGTDLMIETLEVGGEALPTVWKTVTGPVGSCLIAFGKIAYESAQSEPITEDLTITSNQQLLDTFDSSAGPVLFLQQGHAASVTLTAGGESRTFWRGEGYAYLTARYGETGWDASMWHGKIDRALHGGSWSTQDAGPGHTDYDVVHYDEAGRHFTLSIQNHLLVDVEMV